MCIRDREYAEVVVRGLSRMIPGLAAYAGNVACVYCRGSWVNGRPPNGGSESKVRVMIVWRKEADGQWRVAQELMNADV